MYAKLTHGGPQLQNELEESINAKVGVPLKKASAKHTDPQENGNSIPNICKKSTPKPVARVVHRTNVGRNATRDIDHQENAFKKPDTVLQCPRCHSWETKFCYFNNYDVNQPRHFCKNCQRYWTAGGTIRNIPVGAGRRKNKHLALQYCETPMTPDAASVIQTDSSDMLLSSNGLSVTSKPVKGKGNIPSLREEGPLSESLETVLSLKGQTKIEMDSSSVQDDDGEGSSSSSMRSIESREKEYSENGIKQVNLTQHYNGLIPSHLLHCYSVPSWAYEWNPCWNATASRPGSMTSSSATVMAVPGFFIPMVEVPVAPYLDLGCLSSWAGQEKESCLVESTFSGITLPSSSFSNCTYSGDRSPTLGKHSRDGSTLTEDAMKQNLWVPKTVRINDSEEAAKRSIWSTLGTKSAQNKLIMKGSVFKSFEPKSTASSHILDDNQILRANPAAFSRSESFHEIM
ncbi:hypothetical protein VNO77_38920 [Canavalia gladiata]|uniref:Dof-type domain-containing protein n=1 Tax=Canavalia gladiata TaxID=3824 RepID=A0AAN9KA38_CANGL